MNLVLAGLLSPDKMPPPEVVLPIIIFLIILCLILLILLQKEKPKQEISYNQSSTEGDVYARMYGENHARSFSRREEPEPVTGWKKESWLDTAEGEEYDSAVLVQKEGQNQGSKYFIDKPEILLGSDGKNDIILWDSSVSSSHAKIKRIGKRFVLFDQVSLRGVFLNGKKLLRPRVLYDFDEIRLGRTVLVFRGK